MSADGSAGVVDPLVTVTATSFENPVDNDPDPANNMVVLALTTGGGAAPDAVDDVGSVFVDETITIDVLDNDTDPDLDLDDTTLRIVSAPTLGTATVVDVGAGAEISYVAPSSAGIDMLVYEVCDQTGLCDTATVTITGRDGTEPQCENGFCTVDDDE